MSLNTELTSNPFQLILDKIHILDDKFSELKEIISTPPPEPKKEKILKSREETKAIFNITDPTLSKRVRDGKLKPIYMGRRVMYDLTDYLSIR